MLRDISAIRWPMSASCPITFQMSISNVMNHPSKCQNKSSSPFCCLFSLLPHYPFLPSCLPSFFLSLFFLSFFFLLFPFPFFSLYFFLSFVLPFFLHLLLYHFPSLYHSSLSLPLICFPSFVFLFHLHLCNLSLPADIMDHEADLTFNP